MLQKQITSQFESQSRQNIFCLKRRDIAAQRSNEPSFPVAELSVDQLSFYEKSSRNGFDLTPPTFLIELHKFQNKKWRRRSTRKDQCDQILRNFATLV